MNEHVTLMHPDARDPTARAISSGFPVDLLNQSSGRLRVLALLYAFVFFMAGIFPRCCSRPIGPDSSGASCSGVPACSASGSRCSSRR